MSGTCQPCQPTHWWHMPTADHATPLRCSCHVMPCHANAMPCDAMPCHLTPMPCHATPCHTCHAMPCHTTPCHAMPCRAATHAVVHFPTFQPPFPSPHLGHDVRVGGVEAQRRGGRAVGHQVHPQQLHGEQALGQAQRRGQEDGGHLACRRGVGNERWLKSRRAHGELALL